MQLSISHSSSQYFKCSQINPDHEHLPFLKLEITSILPTHTPPPIGVSLVCGCNSETVVAWDHPLLAFARPRENPEVPFVDDIQGHYRSTQVRVDAARRSLKGDMGIVTQIYGNWSNV